MAYIKEVRGHTPRVGEGTFVAETAVLIGDVTVGRDSSIWFNTVLRGDVNSITVGDRTNIQDGTVIHTLYDGPTLRRRISATTCRSVTTPRSTVRSSRTTA